MLVSIAWKNIWRNKLRSLIVIIAVTFGLIGGILSVAIMFGASDQRVKDALNDYVSEFQIHHTKYSDNNESKYFIENSEKTEKIISETEGVTAVCSRLKISGMASSPETASGVIINGINPEKEKLVTDIYAKIPDSLGKYFEGIKKNPIVISSKLAKRLKLHVRSKIILTFQEKNGTQTGGAFRVCGIYKTANSMFDELNVFVRKKDLAKHTGFDTNNAHEIAVRFDKKMDIAKAKKELISKLKGLSVMDWKEIQVDLAMVNDFMNQMLMVFMMVILLALGFGIINTMLMAVLERVKELGMLMAIGMTKLKIFGMIMLETIFLSIVGGLTGMLISAGIIHKYSETGFNFSSVAEGFEKFGYSAIIYPKLEPDFYFMLSFLIILTGIIASIYPAIKALKLNPSEALRTDA